MDAHMKPVPSGRSRLGTRLLRKISVRCCDCRQLTHWSTHSRPKSNVGVHRAGVSISEKKRGPRQISTCHNFSVARSMHSRSDPYSLGGLNFEECRFDTFT